MKLFLIAALCAFTAACSHDTRDLQTKYSLQKSEKASSVAACPALEDGVYQYDTNPTRLVKVTHNSQNEIQITGGDFPSRIVDGMDHPSDNNFGHSVSYCQNSRIYFEDNGSNGHFSGVIALDTAGATTDATGGFTYFIVDLTVGGTVTSTNSLGKPTPAHFTKL